MKKILVLTALAGFCGAAGAAPAIPAHIEKAVADPARPTTDTSRDAGRKPGPVLAFAGIKPGMVVVDMLAGTGYYTRILARAVGAQGRVYAYFGDWFDDRLRSQGKDPDMQFTDLKRLYPNLGVIHGPLEQFVTPEAVDMVWVSDNYHDMYIKQYSHMNYATVNKQVFASLKHGGIYLVLDHRAVKGAGLVNEALHRMDEDIAKKDIEAAGFKLVGESKILDNPSDDDSKRVFEQGEHDHTDQFLLKFRKP